MAHRTETAQRKLMMLRDLRAAQIQGDGLRLKSALSQRELSSRYGLSGYTVFQLMQQLVEEGVLYTVPRIGTFLGRPPLETVAPYIFVSPLPRERNAYVEQMQAGFYDRIAQLGAASITLTVKEMLWHLSQDNLSPISGAFIYDVQPEFVKELMKHYQTNVVKYGSDNEEFADLSIDTVDFDDEEGGAQATRHLLERGHRNIAFLGLHTEERNSEIFYWSVQREAGWRRMMQNAGQETDRLAFLPEVADSREESIQVEAAHMTAVKLLGSSNITAVLAANIYAAQGLLRALRKADIPIEKWPSIVCFDDVPQRGSTGISYLRLPWEKIGAEAAQLLWERKSGRLMGAAVQRSVKMHLIPRLTCNPDWATSGLAQQQIIQMDSMI